MFPTIRNAFVSAAIATAAISGSFAFAQEIDEATDKAARAAISATQATDTFDNILPQASLALKNNLSANNPDKASEIDAIVDEEALKLVERRGALEREAVKLFAANFTTEELQTIADFFSSETGKKYLATTPLLARELSKAGRVWGQGIQRDLGQNASKRVEELLAQ
ncbi:DUF2059 domain-containing protein [Pseudahrensia aquimaris]|uniref:DUF2059 domain-containing protein n=1 Tax=Pseudahrensia aquimaris TaxID=744461 RepID=A0ABW3FIS0_9HYPH